MALNVTRKELYDLVWTTPRSQIAHDLGISDVRLGKLCREMNVPAPPRGYWANLAGTRRKRKYEKPPLSYTLAERIEEDHASVWASVADFDPKQLDQPIPPPPVLPCSLEESLRRYRLLVDQAPMPKATRGLHPITQKLVAEDERLAKLARSYSWEKPKFQSPEGKEHLQGLNQVLWMLTDLGFNAKSSGTRHIRMWIAGGGHGRSFEVTRRESATADGRRANKRSAPGYDFWFDTQEYERHSKKPALSFSAFTRAALRSIAYLVIENWERGFRESVSRGYEWRVAERKQVIAQAEAARERERERIAAERRALLESRGKLMAQAISDADRSDGIRSLVRALDERIGPHKDQVPEFDRWRAWALAEADSIDPRARSLAHLNEWFEKFRLDR
jgi:hypothetical protein